jgi:Nitrate and nitrite sensing/Histidine kinase-, DNA gyrase B-, and HSP90-like ATPase
VSIGPGDSGPLTRKRSIRYLILGIAWLPSLVLLSGGMVLAGQSLLEGARIRAETDAFNAAVPPTADFIGKLLVEQRQSMVYAADPAAPAALLTGPRAQLDAVSGPIQAQFHRLAQLRPEQYQVFAGQLDAFLVKLPAERERITAHQVSVLDISLYFSGLGNDIPVSLYQDVLALPVASAAVGQTTSVTLLRAIEELNDADGFAAASFVGPGLDAQSYQRFTERIGAAHARMAEVQALLEPATAKLLAAVLAGPAWARLDQHYRAVLQAGPAGATATTQATTQATAPPAVAPGRDRAVPPRPAAPAEQKPDQAQWGQDIGATFTALANVNVRHIQYTAERSGAEADSQVRRGLVGGASLLVVALLVLLLTTWGSGRLIRRLRALRADTLRLSREQLPAIVDRLRAGGTVDVDAELRPLVYGTDELGQVASAFDEAQRTAVAAAIREAETRAGLRAVFLDIAHRSQAIVHRQLKVLDEAERTQEDPEQLALLFQLDHLATRSRRNAENLIILAGGRPGRQWRNPVPLLDIVRSAISEAEDYVRVSVAALPRVEITGAVVADLIHLLAELVDNATSFSPPMSRVEVRGNLVGRGLVLEIEDQGLGIEPERLEELNVILREPPEFQVMALAEEPRLGLFVVAQLAARHGIRVTLTPSPAYGGTRVVALLPTTALASMDPSRALAPGRAPALSSAPEVTPTPEPTLAPAPTLAPTPELQRVLEQRTLEQRAVELRAARGDAADSPAEHAGEWRGPAVPGAPGRPAPLAPVPPLPADAAERFGPAVRFGPAEPFPTRPAEPFPTRPDQPFPTRPAPPAPLTPTAPYRPTPERAPVRPGLPRRTPQTHLSPRLATDALPVSREPRPVPDLPDAEQARSRMSALQRGTMRGRATDPEAPR